MIQNGPLRIVRPARLRAFGLLAPAAICVALGGCSMQSTGLNTNIVRDNGKVYTYRAGVVKCDDGRKIPYHPTDYEKENGFSLPAICDYH